MQTGSVTRKSSYQLTSNTMGKAKKTVSVKAGLVPVKDWQEQALSQFTVADKLKELAKTALDFTVEAFRNPELAQAAHDKRIELRDARVELEKIGKLVRSQATAFSRSVIEKEKELIAIVSVEEERLKAAEEQVANEKELEKRRSRLPERKERLAKIGYNPTDDELLAMDSEQYEAYYNACVAENNRLQAEKLEAERVQREQEAAAARAQEQAKIDAERAEIDRQRRENEAEALRLENERKAREREEIARIEGEKRAKEEAERKEAEARAEAARIEAAKKHEQELMEKRAKFIEWRESLGWTEQTKNDFKLEETQNGYTLYKKLGVFTK